MASSKPKTPEPIEVQKRVEEDTAEDEQRRRRALIGRQGREETQLAGLKNILGQKLGS